MPIKDSIVHYLYFVIDIKELLNILVVVFHMISLADITYDASIEPFAEKFKFTDPESITWL